MSAHASGGSPMASPQKYHTLPIAVIAQAEQQDRNLKQSELKTLLNFFNSGAKRLEITATLTQHADEIVAAAANRIFYGGSPMVYMDLAKPPNRDNMPGSNTLSRMIALPRKEVLKVQVPDYGGNPLRSVWEVLQSQFGDSRDPLPDGFRPINVRRYGPRRMKNSMRDLAWFLRYVTYAIAAGDASILAVNVRGLRGVIPEDVTEATVVAMREMRWRSLNYFKQDAEAIAIIQEPFDVMIAEYLVEKPSRLLRQGFSTDQQGLEIPDNYLLAAISRPKYVLKPGLSALDQQAAIQAAYRQVFERDITREYGISLTDLESKVKSGEISTKEFIRRLGQSRFYRKQFYDPFVISRVIELAVRHFLGRGLSTLAEFQTYFDVISKGGLPALVDALLDSEEYSDYFGEETVPYLRGWGQEAQECCNWGPQFALFKYSAPVHKVPQFVTVFGEYRKPLPNQHAYGASNDPLEIQFGAIFPQPAWSGRDRPAPVSKDHRRILISCDSGQQNGNGNGNGVNHAARWGNVPSFSHRVLKLDQRIHQPMHSNGNGCSNGNGSRQRANVNSVSVSVDAVIQGVYRQLFGHDPYPEQRSGVAETKLKGGTITLREFVGQVAKSRPFRHLYWDSLYVTKAIEYIHRRLLGRPTFGREEMGRYYDICAHKGFYDLIDAIVDSAEYREVFGDTTVPHERYVTPRGYEMRSRSNGHGAYTTPASLATGTRVADGDWMQASLRGTTGLRYGLKLKAPKNPAATAAPERVSQPALVGVAASAQPDAPTVPDADRVVPSSSGFAPDVQSDEPSSLSNQPVPVDASPSGEGHHTAPPGTTTPQQQNQSTPHW